MNKEDRAKFLALIESKWPWILAGLDRTTATIEQLTARLADVPPGEAPGGDPLRAPGSWSRAGAAAV